MSSTNGRTRGRTTNTPTSIRVAVTLLAATALLSACSGGAQNPEAAPVTVTVTATPTPSAAPPTTPPGAQTSEPADTASATESPAKGTDFGPYATPQEPGISVVDVGWRMEQFLGWQAHFGVVLYNNGPTTNAGVNVQGIHGDAVIANATSDFTHVPANSWFVYGGTVFDLKGRNDTLEVATTSSRRGAGTVIDVGITLEATAPGGRGYQNVPLVLTNSGTKTMQEGSEIYLVLLDENNKIVGGGDGFSNVVIPGGESVRDVLSDVDVGNGGVATVLGYMDMLNADRMFN